MKSNEIKSKEYEDGILTCGWNRHLWISEEIAQENVWERERQKEKSREKEKEKEKEKKRVEEKASS